jgi:hypothetical protein
MAGRVPAARVGEVMVVAGTGAGAMGAVGMEVEARVEAEMAGAEKVEVVMAVAATAVEERVVVV